MAPWWWSRVSGTCTMAACGYCRRLLLLLATLTSVLGVSTDYGVYIGALKYRSANIMGHVYVVDEHTLLVRNFSYQGVGRDTYFWIGKNTRSPSPDGIRLTYPDDGSVPARPLQNFDNVELVLRLPTGVVFTQMKWLSLWCQRFTVDFGHVLIPAGVQPPRARHLSEFTRLAHKVRSGRVIILDVRTFYIPNLHYDGEAPDAFFWVGNGSEPNPAGIKIPDQTGSYKALGPYMGQDIEIVLPRSLTVYGIEWLAIWSVRYRHNFGWVAIPADLDNIPPHIRRKDTEVSRLWPSFDEMELAKIWTSDQSLPEHKQAKTHNNNNEAGHNTFNRDALLPDSGESLALNSCRAMAGGRLQVRSRIGASFLYVRLSARLRERQWFAFGLAAATVTDSRDPSTNNSHGQASSLSMDGADVTLAFYSASDDVFHAQDYRLSNALSCRWLRTQSVFDRHGHTKADIITRNWTSGINFQRSKRPLEERLLHSLVDDGGYRDDRDGFASEGSSTQQTERRLTSSKRMAMESSGSARRRRRRLMTDAVEDAVILCPDREVGGENDVQIISGSRRKGVTSVTFKRRLNTGDANADLVYERFGEMRAVAAIGHLNARTQNIVTKKTDWHQAWIDLSGAGDGSCGDFPVQADIDSETTDWSAASPPTHTTTHAPVDADDRQEDFRRHSIVDVQQLNARLGPSGGWLELGLDDPPEPTAPRLVWWINGVPMPELFVRRGRQYSFVVEGGHQPTNPAEYHPLYITSDRQGGYASKNWTERRSERVYAGVQFNSIGGPRPTAAGRLCKYMSKPTLALNDEPQTFDEFHKSLELRCRPGQPASLTWLVAQDTPDIVYYQCYTHRGLGWRVHVLDEQESVVLGSAAVSVPSSLSLTCALMTSAAFVAARPLIGCFAC